MKKSSIVLLCSGGLDSSVILHLSVKDKITVHPIFIDYGQLAKEREWKSCLLQCKIAKVSEPKYIDVSGYGKSIPSGLTNDNLKIKEDAFLPGRNHLFLLIASAHAFQLNCNTVAIGLLNESSHLFPDQTSTFLRDAEEFINKSLGREIRIVAPLFHLNKAQVEGIAKNLKISRTYSCHAGASKPCGKCISCLEVINSHTTLKKT